MSAKARKAKQVRRLWRRVVPRACYVCAAPTRQEAWERFGEVRTKAVTTPDDILLKSLTLFSRYALSGDEFRRALNVQ